MKKRNENFLCKIKIKNDRGYLFERTALRQRTFKKMFIMIKKKNSTINFKGLIIVFLMFLLEVRIYRKTWLLPPS